MVFGAIQWTAKLCFLETRDQRPPSSKGDEAWLSDLGDRPQRRCSTSLSVDAARASTVITIIHHLLFMKHLPIYKEFPYALPH